MKYINKNSNKVSTNNFIFNLFTFFCLTIAFVGIVMSLFWQTLANDYSKSNQELNHKISELKEYLEQCNNKK